MEQNIPFGYNDNGQPIESKMSIRKIIGIRSDQERFKIAKQKEFEWQEIQRSFPSTPQDADLFMKKFRNENN